MKRLKGLLLTIRSVISGIVLLGAAVGFTIGGASPPAGAATQTPKTCITDTLTWTYNANDPNADLATSGRYKGDYLVTDNKLEIEVAFDRNDTEFAAYPPYHLAGGVVYYQNGQKDTFSYIDEGVGSPANSTISRVILHGSTCVQGPPAPTVITIPIKTIPSKAVLHAGHSHLKVGQRVALTATVTPPIEFRLVELQEYRAKRWVQIGTLKTNAKGVGIYRLKLTSPGSIRLRLFVPDDSPWNATTSNAIVEVATR